MCHIPGSLDALTVWDILLQVAGFVKFRSASCYRPRCQVQQTADVPRSWFGSGGGLASFHSNSRKGASIVLPGALCRNHLQTQVLSGSWDSDMGLSQVSLTVGITDIMSTNTVGSMNPIQPGFSGAFCFFPLCFFTWSIIMSAAFSPVFTPMWYGSRSGILISGFAGSLITISPCSASYSLIRCLMRYTISCVLFRSFRTVAF